MFGKGYKGWLKDGLTPEAISCLCGGVPHQNAPASLPQYHEKTRRLAKLFDYYNAALFDNSLPQCSFSIAKLKYAWGVYTPDGTGNIALDVGLIDGGVRHYKVTTLVHEMVHHWQSYSGADHHTEGWHNGQFIAKMNDLGIAYDNPQNNCHDIIRWGKLDYAMQAEFRNT